MTIDMQGLDGYETFVIDSHTVGIRPKWISVKERLPDFYDYVLVLADNPGTNEPKPISIARVRIQDEKWEFCEGKDPEWVYGAYMDIEYSIEKNDITHWMPLPQPPKE